MVDQHPALQRSRRRLEYLGSGLDVDLLACDRCGGEMQVRSSQLNEDPCRDDIRIKCAQSCCWWTRHGVPLAREEYEDELAERRTEAVADPVSHVDAVSEPRPEGEETPMDRLEAMGYVDR